MQSKLLLRYTFYFHTLTFQLAMTRLTKDTDVLLAKARNSHDLRAHTARSRVFVRNSYDLSYC